MLDHTHDWWVQSEAIRKESVLHPAWGWGGRCGVVGCGVTGVSSMLSVDVALSRMASQGPAACCQCSVVGCGVAGPAACLLPVRRCRWHLNPSPFPPNTCCHGQRPAAALQPRKAEPEDAG
eukprot:363766-Chlamydomonas_euryale.AAC.8